MWSKRAGVANEYAFVVFEPPVLERPSSAAGPRRRISPGPFPISSAPFTTRVSPVTFGLAAPVILLPERFLAMNAQSQAAIACHELLHVRRHDWAHHLAEETIGAVLWFHPGIAWLIARIRLAREQVVDLDVLRLTNARKPYLEALLEFANARGSLATIPAPPFLAERQLVERITLMLKEVRMSRTRLVASLTASSCGIALAIIFAVWSFPLKPAPHFGPYPPQRGVVAPGVSGGVGSGASGRGAPSGGPFGG